MDGSNGSDTLYGGKGADVFQISKGADIVLDFSVKQGDKIALEKTGEYVISNDPEGVLIWTGFNKQLFLEGVRLSDISDLGIDLFVKPQNYF